MDKVGIGIIGCGNISDAYLKAIVGFPLLEVRGVADIRPEAALAAAAKHGLKAWKLWSTSPFLRCMWK